MRVLRKRGNVWIWGGVGMIVGPFVLGQLNRITGVSIGLPVVGSGNGG